MLALLRRSTEPKLNNSPNRYAQDLRGAAIHASDLHKPVAGAENDQRARLGFAVGSDPLDILQLPTSNDDFGRTSRDRNDRDIGNQVAEIINELDRSANDCAVLAPGRQIESSPVRSRAEPRWVQAQAQMGSNRSEDVAAVKG